jgi:hypothetical protein
MIIAMPAKRASPDAQGEIAVPDRERDVASVLIGFPSSVLNGWATMSGRAVDRPIQFG